MSHFSLRKTRCKTPAVRTEGRIFITKAGVFTDRGRTPWKSVSIADGRWEAFLETIRQYALLRRFLFSLLVLLFWVTGT